MTISRKIQLGLVPIFLLALLLPTPSLAQVPDHLVISQIQITGGSGKSNYDFIELYNPNIQSADLKGYRLVKRTKDGSADSLIKSFADSIFIPGNGYFLWANSEYAEIPVTPDATTTATVASDNAVALRFGATDTGVIVDAVGWGLAANTLVEGSAYPTSPQEGQVLLRTSNLDTNSNSADFELGTPNPHVAGQQPIFPDAGSNTEPVQEEEPQEEPQQPPVRPSVSESEPNVSQLIISEIVPNPAGRDNGLEWVEFYNEADTELNLGGWLIDDSGAEVSANAYKIPLNTKIPGKGYLVITLAEGSPALNNTGGDCVRVFTQEKFLAKNLCYQDIFKEGSSFARMISGSYASTTEPTPGLANRFPVPSGTSTGGGSNNSSSSTVSSAKIIISELLPRPEGEEDEEFIEVYNSGSEEIDLTGWKVKDKTRSYAVSVDDFGDTTLSPGVYFVIPRTVSKIALNNTGGETVELLFADKVFDTVTYEGSVKAGSVYVRGENGKFSWSATPTPGAKNIFTEFEEEEEALEDGIFEEETIDGVASTTPGVLSIKDARSLPDESNIRITGQITALPGVLGSNVSYIADENGYGLRILLARGKVYPELMLGDQVEILGELATTRNERVLKVSDDEDIGIISAGDPPKPHDVRTGGVGESLEGGVVRVSGTVSSTSGNTFYINDGSGDVRVYIVEGTGISKPKMKRGDAVVVTGIVSQFDDTYRLMPRSQDDIASPGMIAGLALAITGMNFLDLLLYIAVAGVSVWLLADGLRSKNNRGIIT